MIENFISVAFGEYYNFSETWGSICKKGRRNGWDPSVVTGSLWCAGAGGTALDIETDINNFGFILDADMPYETIYNVGNQNYDQYSISTLNMQILI